MRERTGTPSVSDEFMCGPSAADCALLEDAFRAISMVYSAQREQNRRFRDRTEQVEVEELLSLETVPLEALILADRSLGDCTGAIFDHYIEAAYWQGKSGTDNDDVPAYTGLPIPYILTHFDTDDEGVEWLSFGEIGPIPLATGVVPDDIETVLLQRSFGYTDNWDGAYVVRIYGHDIDPFGSKMG